MPETFAISSLDWLLEANITTIILIVGIAGWLVYRVRWRWTRRSLRWPSKTKTSRHRRNVQTAERVLEELKSWDNVRLLPRIIAYLRQIDPYVFEELVLTALDQQGCTIKRNHRYSGDGGIDGKFRWDGKLYLVQAKRYRQQIQTQHLQDFSEAIGRDGADGGLFVHTGKTPSSAYVAIGIDPRITLVSGQQLVDLVRGAPTALARITGMPR